MRTLPYHRGHVLAELPQPKNQRAWLRCGFGLVLLCLCGAWETPASQARRYLKELKPAKLHQSATGKEARQPLRQIRVRVHADTACASGVSPKSRFTTFFKQVNAFVGPGFNVQFALIDVRRWNSKLAAAQLDDMLHELVGMDPGDDVDLVVGCVSPLQIETSSVHEAGRAHVLGKHLVLRPLADVEEERSFREAFFTLDQEEWQAVLAARAAHKAVTFFVHEWAHTLGGQHEREPTWLLHPQWTAKQGAFSYINTRVMEIALRHRLQSEYDPTAEAKELVAFLNNFDSEWSKHDRDWLLGILQARAAGQSVRVATHDEAARPSSPATPTPTKVPVKLAAALDKAESLLEAQDFARALEVVNEAWVMAHELPKVPAPVWPQLAQLCLNVGAFSRGEAALEKAGSNASPTAREVFQKARARVGLSAARREVPPETEAVYTNSFWEIVGLLNDNNLKAAETAIKNQKAFNGTPGYQVLSCELFLRQRKTAAARAACQRAHAEEATLARAHILLASLDEQAKKPAAALAHLQEALAIDSENKAAWHELARHYARSGKRLELQRLSDKYAANFGEPLQLAAGP